ncbi:MAG TPA: hypothetical protein VFK52_12010 [Nocardioidaceae bacterium]|nr:hypothetical protein [Nocardioidaceae bacterium]
MDASLPEQRIVEAAVLVTRSGAVTGWASLRLHGGTFFDGRAADGRTARSVPLVLPGQSRRERPGVSFSYERLEPAELTTLLGIPCTRPRRALFDEMRRAPTLRDAVVAMDMAAAARIMSIGRMRSHVATRAGWAGVEQVRAALDLADEDSRSPQETRARLIWIMDAQLPRPHVNPPVFDRAGRLLGYPDLLDVEAGLVVEYDGDDHRSSRRHSDDVDREALFRAHGLEVTRLTTRDVGAPDRAVIRLHTARSRARWLPPARRAWTLTVPEDYRIELPLDIELDLRGEAP